MTISEKTKKKPGQKTRQKSAQNSTNSTKKREKTPAAPENLSNLYSISALSRKFKLDRATVRERLENAEIEPVSTKAKEKLYLLEDVEIILSQSELNEAKFRKLDAEAELKALELKKRSGEYASKAEFTEIIQKMMGGFYTKTVVALPTRIASKLHNANSSAEVIEILREELIREWKNLRDNYPDYINADSRSHRAGNR